MITLSPMTEGEYAGYLEASVKGYARDKVLAGNMTADQAEERAWQEFRKLLPDGLGSEGQYLFTIRRVGEPHGLGFVWLGVREESGRRLAILYDIIVHEQYRGQGYGRRALRLVEERAREMGFQELWLHVFGHNHVARKLYETSGYQVTNLNMMKRLGS
jgi:ribosomal protein S18 acetylase RimI-like enzyme